MLNANLRAISEFCSAMNNVISECVDGFYGNHCNALCAHCNKTFPRCSQRNGHCLYGCESNKWKLPECKGLNINCIIYKKNKEYSYNFFNTLQQSIVADIYVLTINSR